MTPGCDSREDNNLSSDAEVPTLPAKTLPLSRSRSVKRDIVGTLQIFVFYSLGDVRDGFARDCPHRHPVLPMLALRDRSRFTPVLLVAFSGDCTGFRRDTGEARHARGEVASGVRAIVSRFGFGGPGCPSISRDGEYGAGPAEEPLEAECGDENTEDRRGDFHQVPPVVAGDTPRRGPAPVAIERSASLTTADQSGSRQSRQ